jgi:hypothetical protein
MGYVKVNLLQLKLTQFLSDIERRAWLYLENIFDKGRTCPLHYSCNRLTYLEAFFIIIEWKKGTS